MKTFIDYITITDEPSPPVDSLDGNWWVTGGIMDNQNAMAEFLIPTLPEYPWDYAFGRELKDVGQSNSALPAL